MSWINFTGRRVTLVSPRLYRGNHFSIFLINFSFKNYPVKVDRWLENIIRQKWKENDHIKRHIWSFCSYNDNNEYGFVHIPLMTSYFSTMLAWKYKIWRLKLPKGPNSSSMLALQLSQASQGRMKEDFFTESKLWKVVHQTRNQNAAQQGHPTRI